MGVTTSLHVWRPCAKTSVFTAFLPRMLDVYGTRHAATSVHDLVKDAPNTCIYSIFPSLYNIFRRSHVLVPLAQMPQFYLQHFCLSVHIFASVQNISTRTLCEVFRPKAAFKKQALFWVRFARLESVAVRSVFARANTDPMVAVVILRIDKTRPANARRKKPRVFRVFRCPTPK